MLNTAGAIAAQAAKELTEELALLSDAQLDALEVSIQAVRRKRASIARLAEGELSDAEIEAMTPAQQEAYIAGEAVA